MIDPFFRNYKWIRYTYDFGDEWRHRINIEKHDEDYEECYVKLLKYKGDNFKEDCGGIGGGARIDRYTFDQEEIKHTLCAMMLPEHKELKEPRLLKESLNEFQSMIEKLSDMKPEVFNSVIADMFQKADNEVPKMDQKVRAWDSWKEENIFSESDLKISESVKTQKELMLEIGEKRVADYYKYLRLPPVKWMSYEEKIDNISEALKEHQEYILYILDKDEYEYTMNLINKTEKCTEDFLKQGEWVKKLLAIGLVDFTRNEDIAELCFASDIRQYIGNLDEQRKRKTYRKLEKFDERVGKMLQIYGMVELESMYGLYQKTYRDKVEKEEYFRYIYWHARFNDFVNTVYSMDGTCYAVLKEINPQIILEKTEKYAVDLPYKQYRADEIDFLAEDLANRNEWVDILFTTLHYQLGMDIFDAQYWLIETVSAVVNGDTIDLVIENIEKQSKKQLNLTKKAEVWQVVSGLMLEMELPMLKGRSRIEYEMEQGISAWTLGMVPDDTDKILNDKRSRMYQFPQKIQECMYMSDSIDADEQISELSEYKEQNHICSEEYIYLLAEFCIENDKIKKANELIQELKNSSAKGRKAAKSLEEIRDGHQEIAGELEGDDWIAENIWDYLESAENVQQPYIRTMPKVGRNDPCPCGSGKKYKKCCGRNE